MNHNQGFSAPSQGQPSVERPLFQKSVRLEQELSRIGEQLTLLKQKLDPVLIPTGPVPISPHKEEKRLEELVSPLIDMFNAHIKTSKTLFVDLEDILNRINL